MEALIRSTALIWGIMAICVAVEVVLSLADWGVIGVARLRLATYEFGGFWPGLLGNWEPNYTAQPYVMFISYGFLHGGLMHLVINMITLNSLGRAVIDRVGSRGFALLYIGALLGGAFGYYLLSSGLRPMVGASGALFGLAGGLVAWGYVDRFTQAIGLWPIAQAVILLILLNVVMYWALDGQLAWETHLGGFIGGWIMAFLIDPRPTDPEDAQP